MAEEPKPEETGAGAPEAEPAPPRRGYIPRPPSQADLDRVSEAQGLITDEWAPGDETQGGGDSAAGRGAAGGPPDADA